MKPLGQKPHMTNFTDHHCHIGSQKNWWEQTSNFENKKGNRQQARKNIRSQLIFMDSDMTESIEEKLNRGEHVLIRDAMHIPRVAEFMADIASGKISMCGCLGPQYGEPYCPCQMTQRGLPSSEKRIAAQRRDAINNAKSALPGSGWHKFVNGNLKK